MIGAAVIGGLAQASAAKSAAKAQTNAANKDIEFQRETRDMAIERLDPFYQSGMNALAAYNYELGLGDKPMVGGTPLEITTISGTPEKRSDVHNRDGLFDVVQKGTPDTYSVGGQTFDTMEAAQAYANANATGGVEYGGYTKTPGYDFRLNEGIRALDNSAASRGNLLSGATQKAALQYGQNYATNEYGNYMNRLAGLTDGGMAAATGQNAAGQNAAAGISNAYANIGNAQAAGAVGVGNALSGTLNNISGIWGYQKALNGGQAGGNPFSIGMGW